MKITIVILLTLLTALHSFLSGFSKTVLNNIIGTIKTQLTELALKPNPQQTLKRFRTFSRFSFCTYF
jgi:hypothetical protein